MGLYEDMANGKLSHDALHHILDNIPDELLIINEEFKVIYANTVKRRRFGPNLLGRKCHSVIEGRKDPCESCPVLQAIQLRRIIRRITVTRRHGRRSYVSIAANPLYDEKGDVVGAIETARDITSEVERESLRLMLTAAKSYEEILKCTIHSFSNVLIDASVLLCSLDIQTGHVSSPSGLAGIHSWPALLKKKFLLPRKVLREILTNAVSWTDYRDFARSPLKKYWGLSPSHGVLVVAVAALGPLAFALLFHLHLPPDSVVMEFAKYAAYLAAEAFTRIREKSQPISLDRNRDFNCSVRATPCRFRVELDPTAVFVALGRSVEDDNLFQFGVLPAVVACGRRPLRPNIDCSGNICEVCRQIRSSILSVVDISAWSGNALFELGMIYGLGREAILIKRCDARAPVDLQGIEYVPYEDYFELEKTLTSRLYAQSSHGIACSLRDRCFKFGAKCQHPEEVQEEVFFVGMPFRKKFENPYKAAIRPALESVGFQPWKADEEPRIIDIMCKVCRGIQISRGAIINLTTWNPNVLFELGLALALNKPVLLIREENDRTGGELQPLKYLKYSDLSHLRRQIEPWLKKFRRE